MGLASRSVDLVFLFLFVDGQALPNVSVVEQPCAWALFRIRPCAARDGVNYPSHRSILLCLCKGGHLIVDIEAYLVGCSWVTPWKPSFTFFFFFSCSSDISWSAFSRSSVLYLSCMRQPWKDKYSPTDRFVRLCPRTGLLLLLENKAQRISHARDGRGAAVLSTAR